MSDTTDVAEGTSDQLVTEGTPGTFDSLSSEEKESLVTDFQNDSSWKTKNQERSTEIKKGEASLKEKTEAFEAREKLFNESHEKRLREVAQRKPEHIGENAFLKMRREQEQTREINRAIYNNKLGDWKLALAEGKERHPDMDLEKIMKLEQDIRTNGQDYYIDILHMANKGEDIERKMTKSKAEGYNPLSAGPSRDFAPQLCWYSRRPVNFQQRTD